MNARPLSAGQAFTVNLVRFKNFRDRMNRAHDREVGTLRKTVDAFEKKAEAHFAFLRRRPTDVADLFAASSAKRLGEDALSWASMVERHLDMLPNEAALGREMAFVYLMAILDSFVARWRVETGLDANEKAEAARPDVIRRTCRELNIAFEFPDDFDGRLAEMRARRNVLVHRGGIADSKYCDVARNHALIGQRLEVTEEYLERADNFVTELGLTLIVRSPRSLRDTAED